MGGLGQLPFAGCGRSGRWARGAKSRGRDGTRRYCLRETAWRASVQRGGLGGGDHHLDLAVAVAVLGWRLGQRQGELAPGADGLVVALVGFDNALHEDVTHDVFLVELHETDAFDTAEHIGGVDETAAPAGGKIDLGDVSVDHHLGVEALAGEHHLHLLGGAVLRWWGRAATWPSSAARRT